MQRPSVFIVIGLAVLLTAATTGSCKKGLSEKEIRRIVRDEVQEQLRVRKSRKSPRPAGFIPQRRTTASDPGASTTADPKTRRTERLLRRIQTMERLVAQFSKTPSVSPDRLKIMKKQLAKMREQLARAEGKASSPTTPEPVNAPQSQKDWQDALSAGVKKLGKQRWQVDRRILSSVMTGNSRAGKDAAIGPHRVGGKPRGFKLLRIRPKGLFDVLGFKSGDVVERVNNSPIDTPSQALTLYTKLSKIRLLTIVLRRAGQRIVHVYTLK